MDYESFYGLEKEPFGDIPDPDFFYSGPEHTRALVKLLHVVKKNRAMGLLTGDVGCGKTTIIRKILADLNEDDNYIASLMVLTHPDFNPLWFTRKLGDLLGIQVDGDSRTDMTVKITEELHRRYRNGMSTVILIDEANNITDSDVIEEIRGLLNLELDGRRLVTFILSGLREVYDRLRSNTSLRQRISTVVDLPPLTLNSTKEYINHRLEMVGGDGSIFDDDAYSLIFDYTDGIPRLINVICDNALLEGALLKKKVVGESIINRVSDELMLRE